MPIQRQDVGSLGEVQRNTYSTQTSAAVGRTSVSTGENFVQDLFQAAGEAARGATGFLQERVAEDKVKQQQRAIMGLAPTDDATKGGTRAHMLVGAQNTIQGAALKLKNDAATFQGTDDEWEQHVADSNKEIQQGIMDAYPELQGDKHTQAALTNMFLEQTPSVAGSRVLAKIQQDHSNRLDTMRDRILLETQGKSPEEIGKILPRLKQEGVTMQLTDPEVNQLFTQVAVNQSNTGDTNFIEATKNYNNKDGVSLYTRSGQLQGGMIRGRKVYAQNHAEELAGVKSDLLSQYQTSDMTFDEFRSQAGLQNDKYGEMAWSKEQILAARDNKARDIAAHANYNSFTSDLMNGKLEHLTEMKDKDIKGYSSKYISDVGDQAEQEADKLNLSGDERERYVNTKVAKGRALLARSNIIDSKFDEQMKSLTNLDPENFKDQKVEPEEFKKVMDQWRALPKGMRVNALSPASSAFAQNYQDGLDLHMNPAQALNYAQGARKNIKFSKQVSDKLNDTVSSVVDDVSSGSWFTTSDNLSDVQKEHATQAANRIVYNLYKAGYRGDSLEEASKDYLSNNYSMVDGVAFEGSTKGLAQQMQVNTNDIPFQMKGYIQMNKQKLLDAVGVDDDKMDNFYWDIDTTRGIARVRYGTQGDLTLPPISINELGKVEYARAGKEAVEHSHGNTYGSLEYQAVQGLSRGAGAYPPEPDPVGKRDESGEGITKIGETRKWNEFNDEVMGYENKGKVGFDPSSKVWIPYDSDVGTKGVDTIAYGHYITKQENKDGYITIGGQPVRFKDGESEITESQAKALFQQDMDSVKKQAEGRFKGFSKLEGDTQRAILDTMYNAGPNFLARNPKAAAKFKKGDYEGGFRTLLDYVDDGGKRSSGLFKRRLKAYNRVAEDKATKYRINENGSFEFKDSNGWHTAIKPKKNSLHPNSKTGTFDI